MVTVQNNDNGRRNSLRLHCFHRGRRDWTEPSGPRRKTATDNKKTCYRHTYLNCRNTIVRIMTFLPLFHDRSFRVVDKREFRPLPLYRIVIYTVSIYR